MGIHFVCHHCSFALHVKDFQAGKRGKCPSCSGSFRIPTGDSSYSSALDDAIENPNVTKVKQAFQKINSLKSPSRTSDSSGSISIALEPNPTAIQKSSKEKLQTVPPFDKSDRNEPLLPIALPIALSQSPGAKWFVRPPTGGQFGPAPAQILISWVTESRITADSLLCQEGTDKWQVASELLPEMFPTAMASKVSLDTVPIQPTPFVDPAVIRTGAILKKRMQKRKQQLTLVIILATASLVLFSILIYVLVFQNNKPPSL